MTFLGNVEPAYRNEVAGILIKALRSFREMNPGLAGRIVIKSDIGLIGGIALVNEKNPQYYIVLGEVYNIAPPGVEPRFVVAAAPGVYEDDPRVR